MHILKHFKFVWKYSDLVIEIDKEINRLQDLRNETEKRWKYHHTKFMNKNVLRR